MTWQQASGEGRNPQAFTYAPSPMGPFSYTRSQFARAVRDYQMKEASDERHYRLTKRYPIDLQTFKGQH